LRKLARRGEVYQVVRDLFYHPDAVRELVALVASLARQHNGALGASAFRDASGLGRKRAIQILEFFDRVGYTRFQRDLRLVRADSRLLEAL
jgi:selenocysteine-specific elongation factor